MTNSIGLSEDIDERYFALVEANLRDGETVLASGPGLMKEVLPFNKKESWVDGVLVITNSRVIRFHKFWFNEKVIGVPLSKISSVQVSKGMLGLTTLEFITSNEDFWIKMAKPIADRILPVIEDAREATEKSSTVAEAKGDPLDQIKKLSELKESGILTDQEFQEKKAKLLDLL